MLTFYKGSENLDIPEERPKRERGERPNRSEARNSSFAREYKGKETTAEPGYARLFINLGKRDGIFPKQLIALMNSMVHHRIEMGRIDLLTNFSYFEVPEKDARFVVKDMTGADWKGRKVVVQPADATKPEGNDRPKKKFEHKNRNYEENIRNHDDIRNFGERMQHKQRGGRRGK